MVKRESIEYPLILMCNTIHYTINAFTLLEFSNNKIRPNTLLNNLHFEMQKLYSKSSLILQYACLFRYKVHARHNMELYHVTLCRLVTWSCMVLIFFVLVLSQEKCQALSFYYFWILYKKIRKFIVICFHSSRTFLEEKKMHYQ